MFRRPRFHHHNSDDGNSSSPTVSSNDSFMSQLDRRRFIEQHLNRGFMPLGVSCDGDVSVSASTDSHESDHRHHHHRHQQAGGLFSTSRISSDGVGSAAADDSSSPSSDDRHNISIKSSSECDGSTCDGSEGCADCTEAEARVIRQLAVASDSCPGCLRVALRKVPKLMKELLLDAAMTQALMNRDEDLAQKALEDEEERKLRAQRRQSIRQSRRSQRSATHQKDGEEDVTSETSSEEFTDVTSDQVTATTETSPGKDSNATSEPRQETFRRDAPAAAADAQHGRCRGSAVPLPVRTLRAAMKRDITDQRWPAISPAASDRSEEGNQEGGLKGESSKEKKQEHTATKSFKDLLHDDDDNKNRNEDNDAENDEDSPKQPKALLPKKGSALQLNALQAQLNIKSMGPKLHEEGAPMLLALPQKSYAKQPARKRLPKETRYLEGSSSGSSSSSPGSVSESLSTDNDGKTNKKKPRVPSLQPPPEVKLLKFDATEDEIPKPEQGDDAKDDEAVAKEEEQQKEPAIAVPSVGDITDASSFDLDLLMGDEWINYNHDDPNGSKIRSANSSAISRRKPKKQQDPSVLPDDDDPSMVNTHEQIRIHITNAASQAGPTLAELTDSACQTARTVLTRSMQLADLSTSRVKAAAAASSPSRGPSPLVPEVEPPLVDNNTTTTSSSSSANSSSPPLDNEEGNGDDVVLYHYVPVTDAASDPCAEALEEERRTVIRAQLEVLQSTEEQVRSFFEVSAMDTLNLISNDLLSTARLLPHYKSQFLQEKLALQAEIETLRRSTERQHLAAQETHRFHLLEEEETSQRHSVVEASCNEESAALRTWHESQLVLLFEQKIAVTTQGLTTSCSALTNENERLRETIAKMENDHKIAEAKWHARASKALEMSAASKLISSSAELPSSSRSTDGGAPATTNVGRSPNKKTVEKEEDEDLPIWKRFERAHRQAHRSVMNERVLEQEKKQPSGSNAGTM